MGWGTVIGWQLAGSFEVTIILWQVLPNDTVSPLPCPSITDANIQEGNYHFLGCDQDQPVKSCPGISEIPLNKVRMDFSTGAQGGSRLC